jgi:lipoate-protein ligase A
VGYEKFDVLWHGKKIAGAAQRRNKLGLLIQGSVQPPPLGLKREDWERAMQTAGAKMFGAEWTEAKADEAFSSRVAELVREKYSQRSYNEKR